MGVGVLFVFPNCQSHGMATTQDAYRRMAQRVHPDSDGGSADRDKFEAVTAAYDVLSDPGKRSTYDQVGACLCRVCSAFVEGVFGRAFGRACGGGSE